ncbi:hypothetical protein IMZ48_04230 [Candidatus Bathyarchaeota archaeon]|nr:hypothetical protein [Candidatus Bathyarchaeota archaeon]
MTPIDADMEPVSIIGTCSGLISLIITATTAAAAFIRVCRGARGDLTTVIGDLTQLKTILDLLKNDDTSAVSKPMQAEILSLLQDCAATVGDIENVVEALGDSKAFPMRWAASGKQRVESLRAKLKGYSDALGFTIDIVGM